MKTTRCPSTPHKYLVQRVLVLCLAAGATPPSLAAEYAAEPTVALQEIYNDNIRLSRATHEGVTGTILTPRLNLIARTATWQLGTELRWRAARYHGIEGLDSNDRTVNLYSQVQSERNALQFGGGRARDSILTGEITDADTGLVKSQTFRITDSANGSWTWSITEKDQFKLGYQYADVSYLDNGVSGLYDYSQRGPSATLTHQVSERTQVFLQVSNGIFDIPKLSPSHVGHSVLAFDNGTSVQLDPSPRALSISSATNSLQFGVDYQFSETLKGNLTAGKHKTSSEYAMESCTSSTPPVLFIIPDTYIATCLASNTVTETNDTRGSIYSINLAKNFSTSNLSGRLERAIDPSGAGALVQRDTLSLNMGWSKTQRLTFLFTSRGDKIRAIEGDTVSVDRNQYFIEPSLQWRLTEDSRLNLAYRYTHLKYESETEAANSNQVNLTFSQAWRRKSVSR